MQINFDLPDTLPIFPLPGALLLPRSRLPLQIFEPRYLAMLDDCLKTDHRMIGMIQPCTGSAGDQGLHKIGCAGRVAEFSETDDGRYMVTLSGICRFRVVSEVQGFSPYRKCDVSWVGFERDMGPAEKDNNFDRHAFLTALSRFFDEQELTADWDTLQDADEELLINSLSMLCPFKTEDKQALLEAPQLSTRRETLVTPMEFAMRGGLDKDIMQ